MTEEPPRPPVRLRPVSMAVLASWAVVGLVLGALIRPVSVRWLDAAPLVSWSQALLLFFVAAVIAVTARATARAMRGERERPAAHQMVNRFVLARASALVGALMAGVYAGYALSWVGIEAELASQRLIRSAVGALGGAATAAAAVALERACRIKSDDKDP